MPIAVGDTFPEVTVKRLGEAGVEEVNTKDLLAGKTTVLFAVPGAFTPTCSARHLPGFIDKAGEFSAKGVDQIVCMSVNDPFVMKVWGEQANAGDAVVMLPDGNGEVARALGLTMDGTAAGLGERSQRFGMVVKDGVVTALAVEEPMQFEVSSAEAMLQHV